ncbi:MAG: ABC transporter ATP-binding protein [Polyangiaceae bacterium]|nr:ABC transporter ATP-binding protein [Polyangiaceae bacterium]
MDAVVRFEKVSKVYRVGGGDVHALREVSFSVGPGEMVAIMGTSGSGKSTALNILGALDRPSSGQYVLDGEPVEGRSEAELAQLRNRKLGFIFQSFHLLPRHTALSNVELPLVYAEVAPRERRRRSLAALDRVGLAERADHLPGQLSGGQQQRVAIARALVNEPKLLLADEPTGALDSATTSQIMALLVELHRAGVTVIVVTHDPSVGGYADRMLRFADGRIVEDERVSGERIAAAHVAEAPLAQAGGLS